MEMNRLEIKLVSMEETLKSHDAGAMGPAITAAIANCRNATTDEERTKKWGELRTVYGISGNLPQLQSRQPVLPAAEDVAFDSLLEKQVRKAAMKYAETVLNLINARGTGKHGGISYSTADEFADQQVDLMKRNMLARYAKKIWDGTIAGLSTQDYPVLEEVPAETPEGDH